MGSDWTSPNRVLWCCATRPNDIYVDQWFYRLLDTLESVNARRVVIDSLGDLAVACPDDKRFREFIYPLLNDCSRAGISAILTFESPELYGHTRLSERGVSHLSDNVILLQYVRKDAALSRALTVLKTRASDHLPQTHEYRDHPRWHQHREADQPCLRRTGITVTRQRCT